MIFYKINILVLNHDIKSKAYFLTFILTAFFIVILN